MTHSNHLGTHLDGEIHFFTPGKDVASLDLNDVLCGPAAVVDLSDTTGDYQIYTAKMIEERVEAREAHSGRGKSHNRCPLPPVIFPGPPKEALPGQAPTIRFG